MDNDTIKNLISKYNLDRASLVEKHRSELQQYDKKLEHIQALCTHDDVSDNSWVHPHSGKDVYNWKCNVCGAISYKEEGFNG